MTRVEKNAASAIEGLRAGPQKETPTTKHIFVLMDESGSMSGLEEAVTNGCNEFIHAFAGEPGARIWLAWFDKSPGEDPVRVKVKGAPPAEVELLVPGDYSPRGMTPLNDAIATAVNALDAVAGEDSVVFLAIITDGMENASEISTRTIKKILSAREEAGWGIVFIGANQDAVATAADLGMHKAGSAFAFDADEESVRATMHGMSELATARTRHGAGKAGRERYDLEAEKLFRDKKGRLDR